MILTLIGLILTFVGTVVLVIDALVRFGKPKSAIFTPIHYRTNGKPTKFVREKQIYDSRGLSAGYQEIKITKENNKINREKFPSSKTYYKWGF